MTVKPKKIISKVKDAASSWSYASFFESEWTGPHSPFLTSTGIYLLYRFIIWAFVFTNFSIHIIFAGALGNARVGLIVFSYLTIQSMTLVNIYFTLEFFVAIIYFLKEKKNRENIPISIQLPKDNGKVPLWVSAKGTLGNITIVSAFTVTVLYWSLLYAYDDDKATYSNIFIHGLNSVVCVIDIFIIERNVSLYQFYQPILFGVWYISYSIIYFFAGGTNLDGDPYIYPILDWRNPGVAILTVLVSLIVLICNHALYYAFYKIRLFLRKTLLGTSKHKEKSEIQDKNIYTIQYSNDQFHFS
uniref:Protein rolling stone n=1 Tax=Lepeophtheirus salmonis TaxID=72036 RepID=D3PJ39_LEPSM|nr:Protein rolling stone [Lepeophtheirus salmonis]